PKLRHPVDGRTMGELWQAYDKASQQLCPIPFHWEACELQHH
ncbi:MAG: 2-amino-4-hydroxy-6-hydroxymethyldihydropteridine diphosphokinase, partial [Aeromonas veronii]